MIEKIISKITKLFFIPLQRDIWENRILTAKVYIEEIRKKGIVNNLSEVEFKVFSQWGDDGIIQYLLQHIEFPHKTFIEFGVENYTEANTRFLLINNNWSGLIMDGSDKNMAYVQRDPISWRHDLQFKTIFITAENINQLIQDSGFEKEVGILHIDIDGNDYFVWKKVDAISPVVVIMEYNSVFGIDKPISSVYDPAFYRTTHHFSNLLYGSSLLSLMDLAKEKGYTFIGCNSAGNNAYFVRNDKIGNLKPKTIEEGFVDSKFAESRNRDGSLSYLRGSKRLQSLKGNKVFNTRTNQIEIL